MRYLVLLLLAGCVSPQQQAARYPSTVLCYGTVAGTPQQASLARQELATRGHSCTQQDVEMGERQWIQIRQNDATRAAASATAGAVLLAPPPAPSAPVNCSSYRDASGNVRTTCR